MPTAKHTPIFEFGDIIRVPFPYVEVDIKEFRPVLVISHGFAGPRGKLFYSMMITGAGNPGWSDDIPLVDDHLDYGLPRPSLLRVAKIASIKVREAALLGRLYGPKLDTLRETLQRSFVA